MFSLPASSTFIATSPLPEMYSPYRRLASAEPTVPTAPPMTLPIPNPNLNLTLTLKLTLTLTLFLNIKKIGLLRVSFRVTVRVRVRDR